jgi:hypothetical protein
MSFMCQSSASEAIRKPTPSRRAEDFYDLISLSSDDKDDDKTVEEEEDKTVEEDPSGGVPVFNEEWSWNKSIKASLKKR